jgi:hypothetical protein
MPRLLGLVHPQNIASMRALEKIGMTLLKTIHIIDQRGPRCLYIIKGNTSNSFLSFLYVEMIGKNRTFCGIEMWV